MTAASPFAHDYSDARQLFLDAAHAAKGRVESHRHPQRGPDGEELATDVVWLGPEEATSVVVVLSGTHGVEGFCGSGAQVDFMRRREIDRYPAGTGALLVHAVNPFGFAWIRRVNEDNIDVNRNWVDFADPPSANADYHALQPAICPADWHEGSAIDRDPVLVDHSSRHGQASLQAAISSGQWHHPAGVFYGGREPSWSRRTQSSIFARWLTHRRRVAILDIHTGLGPLGFCERIVTMPPTDPAGVRAARWFGAGLTWPGGGTSTSAPIVGDGLSHAIRTLGGVDVAAIALEYGTVPIVEMLDAVRADAWLHAHGDLGSERGREIKARLRNAFYVDDPRWRGMVLGQFLLSAWQAAIAMRE